MFYASRRGSWSPPIGQCGVCRNFSELANLNMEEFDLVTFLEICMIITGLIYVILGLKHIYIFVRGHTTPAPALRPPLPRRRAVRGVKGVSLRLQYAIMDGAP